MIHTISQASFIIMFVGVVLRGLGICPVGAFWSIIGGFFLCISSILGASKMEMDFGFAAILISVWLVVEYFRKKNHLQSIQQRDNEIAQCASLNQYSDLYGQKKRIAMLTAEMKKAEADSKMMISATNSIMKSTQQKEVNWAVRGGVAQGIGGLGLGVAAALDAQAQNAQIRAQNEANRKAYLPTMANDYKIAQHLQMKANSIKKEIDTIQSKIVTKDSAAECLSQLVFSGTKVEVFSSGTCVVTTEAVMMENTMSAKNGNYVIDGTVIAKIYDHDTLIGAANLVLPAYGISKKETIKGMCLNCGIPGRQYTVQFSAINLWRMER